MPREKSDWIEEKQNKKICWDYQLTIFKALFQWLSKLVCIKWLFLILLRRLIMNIFG